MNLSDKSLDDKPSVVTKVFTCVSLVVPGNFMASTVKDDSVVSGDCEDRSKKSTLNRLFLNLQVVCRLIEGLSGYLDEYK